MWGVVAFFIGGGILVAKAVKKAGEGSASTTKVVGTYNVPARVKPWLGFFQKYGAQRGVPVDVALAFAYRESQFSPEAYNPEAGAIAPWAKKIAENPKRWADNPDYEKAVEVHRLISSGERTGKEIALADKGKAFADKLWTFGSIGLMQSSRQSAEAAGYAAALPNAGLFDIATNIAAGVGEIAIWRSIMWKGRDPKSLTDEEWATVRAAYVMGGGNVAKYPEKAEEKRVLFRSALKFVRGQAASA